MRRCLPYVLAAGGAAACAQAEFFVCNGDDDCTNSAGDGVCQPTGGCSFPDPECESGQRYGSQGPPSIANECVQHGGTTGVAEPGTSTGGGDSSGTAALDERAASSSSEGSSSEGAGTTGETCPEGWWDCAYASRHRLSVSEAVATELTNVPVLVVLDETRVDYAGMQNDGEDIRFVTAGGTAAPFEFIEWNHGGPSLAWVMVDELGGSADHLWLYYGNPVAQTPRDLGAVWPAPFAAVWRLDGDATDATDNGNDATPHQPVAFDGGQVAQAQDFLGSDARLTVATSETVGDVFATGGTISAWILPRGWGAGDFGRVGDKFGSGAGWRFYLGANGRLRFSLGWGPMMERTWTTPTGVIELDTWANVAATFDTTPPASVRLYVNGVEAELDPPPDAFDGPPVSDLDNDLLIGNRGGLDRQFHGLIDELRLATETRPSAWFAVQHASATDTLLTYGPAEAQ
ncbi:MAG: DUF2341 domain-containing protein [Myxococcota bacterium]